jgi:thioredoxin reductase (NADPH)
LNDIVIIGAGPAGIAASIYLKRAGIEPLLIEKGKIGGLLLNANLVENYPGFPQGIKGHDLVEVFKKQLSRLGIEVTKGQVSNIMQKDGHFIVTLDGKKLYTHSLIIASGTEPKALDIPGETELTGRKLFYEIKDIHPPVKNDTYVIIGGGDAAFDYALNLASEVKSVDIIFRGKHPKCLALLSERVAAFENIRPHPKMLPRAFEEDEGIITKCTSASQEIDFPSDYALIACGRKPKIDFMPELEQVRIKEDGGCDIPGLFIAGDVKRGKKRQTGIAVGDGTICAMSVVEFLTGEKRK